MNLSEVFLLVLTIAASGANFITKGVTLVDCGEIVKSCQKQCEISPLDFVCWSIDLGGQLSCQRYNGTAFAKPAIEISEPFSTTFNVSCCADQKKTGLPAFVPVSKPSSPSTSYLQSLKIVITKLDRDYILVVATLGCIVFICVIVMFGFIIYCCMSDRKSSEVKQRKDRNTIETKQLIKESEKETSIARTATEVAAINDKQAIPLKQSYLSSAKTTSSGKAESSESSSTFKIQEERAVLLASPPPKPFVVHGGFMSLADEKEPMSKCVFTPETNDTQEHSPNRVIVQTESDYVSVPMNIKSAQSVESDYVQAPPLKSHRCQTKVIPAVDAYNNVVDTTSRREAGDYSLLRHSIVGSRSDEKVFIVVDSKREANNKTEVALPSSKAHEV